MRYNHHFLNQFASCRLLAQTHDPHRNRDVQIRLIPGEFDVVGVTDGVDSWVAPVAGDPFSIGIKRILEDVQAGKDPAVVRPRNRIALSEPKDPEPKPRRKVLLPHQELEPQRAVARARARLL